MGRIVSPSQPCFLLTGGIRAWSFSAPARAVAMAASEMRSPLYQGSGEDDAAAVRASPSAFEITEPPPAQSSSRCFPFEVCSGCPRTVKMMIPGTWRKVQDKTHLALLLGLMSFSTMGVQMVVLPITRAMNGDVELMRTVLAVVTGVFFFCCAPYVIRVVGQYDERLLVKQTQVKKEKESLTRAYHDLLSDMDGLLQKSAESASGLAERSFESKRRDFQRFLERAKQRYAVVCMPTRASSETSDMVTQFRRFCSNWLHVFEECSIDPVVCPKRVVGLEELNACSSIGAVADLCLERLRGTEVRFISAHLDQDMQLVRRKRTELRQITVGGSSPRTMTTTTTSLESGSSCSRMPGGNAPRRHALLSWMVCGRTGCFCLQRSTTPSGFPRIAGCGCVQVTFLSPEHVTLILGFFVGLVLTALEMLSLLEHLAEAEERHGSKSGAEIAAIVGFTEIAVSLLCVSIVLIRFEDIDTVQQLEREVKQLSKQNEEVEQQRDQMKTFWSNAQNLTELWLYRTVPRLDLYKELQSQLLDAPQEDFLVNISGANQWLEDLEGRLGSLEAWRNDGALKPEDKKHFGRAINKLCCQEHEFSDILAKLEDVTTRQMEHMVALPSLRVESELH